MSGLPGFELAAPLRADCHVLGRLPLSHLLLMNKREVPWFILVPETRAVEVCDLDETEQRALLDESNRLARFVRAHFAITKLNVAAIGNIVRQMHIHVIGRREDDPWWPGPAWGQASHGGYESARVTAIAELLAAELGGGYRAA